MRHRKSGRKLNRNSSHRNAMFRNMVTSLFKHDSIKTTDAKAKELRILADHVVTLAKRGDLHARRQAMSIVREKDVVHKLFEEAGERFGKVAGGYTRIVKIGYRRGDAAPVSIIELVAPGTEKKKEKKKKTKPADTAGIAKTAAPLAAAGKTDTADGSEPEAEPSVASVEDAAATEKEGPVETVSADPSGADEKMPSADALKTTGPETDTSVETKASREKAVSVDTPDADADDKPPEK